MRSTCNYPRTFLNAHSQRKYFERFLCLAVKKKNIKYLKLKQ